MRKNKETGLEPQKIETEYLDNNYWKLPSMYDEDDLLKEVLGEQP